MTNRRNAMMFDLEQINCKHTVQCRNKYQRYQGCKNTLFTICMHAQRTSRNPEAEIKFPANCGPLHGSFESPMHTVKQIIVLSSQAHRVMLFFSMCCVIGKYLAHFFRFSSNVTSSEQLLEWSSSPVNRIVSELNYIYEWHDFGKSFCWLKISGQTLSQPEAQPPNLLESYINHTAAYLTPNENF